MITETWEQAIPDIKHKPIVYGPDLYRPEWKYEQQYYDRERWDVYPDAECDVFEHAHNTWQKELEDYKRVAGNPRAIAKLMEIHEWDWFDLGIPYPIEPAPGHFSREQVLESLTMLDVLKYYAIPYRDQYARVTISCPFHKEKTPSLSVDLNKQRWYCFGEGRGGDALAFVREMEESGFPYALKIAAGIAGIS